MLNSPVAKTNLISPEAEEKSRLGWEDARLGKPYNPLYNTWAGWEQRNYERGRLRAINVRAAGQEPLPYLRLPKSNRYDGKIRVMPSIRQQMIWAIEKVGNAVPNNRHLPDAE